MLGCCIGVEQDYDQAMEWFLKASSQGDGNAQNDLGILYHYGEGVEQDYYRAVEWFWKAADKGVERAKRNVSPLLSFCSSILSPLNSHNVIQS